MAETTSNIENSVDSENFGNQSGILMPALQRWPMLLVLMIAGGVIGGLGFTLTAPTYQSNTQVLVIKKADQATVADIRTSYVEDYVSTQIPLIKSERILRAAARLPELSPVRSNLNVDENTLAGIMALNLGISREKDVTGGPTINSAVLNISMKNGDPRNSKLMLEAIIKTYQIELETVYDEATKARIDSMKDRIKSLEKSILGSSDTISQLQRELSSTVKEDVIGIQARVSSIRQRQYDTKLELIRLELQLDLIAKTGDERRERLAMLAQLLGERRPATTDNSQLTAEMNFLTLTSQRQELSETLGKDDARIRSLDKQIEYYQKLLKLESVTEPSKQNYDELTLYQKWIDQKKSSLIAEQKINEAQLLEDEKKLVDGGKLNAEMQTARQSSLNNAQEVEKLRVELSGLESNRKQGGYQATVLNEPHVGTKIGPVLSTWLFPGVFLGALLGVGLAYLADMADNRFKGPAEIRRVLATAVMGHIPPISDDEKATEVDVNTEYDTRLVCALRPKSSEAEAYRGVRAQLLSQLKSENHRVIQITSPSPGDGKSTLAANLAISLAQSGKTTILLDCDFRKPRVHKIFALAKPEIGLASVTSGQSELDVAIRKSDIDNLDLLPCGPRPANPAELLSDDTFGEVLQNLRSRYDYVIVDTPPLLAVSDPRVVSQRVDGVVMTIKITKKSRSLIERAREQLKDMGANLYGVVINGSGAGKDQYGYGYNYAYNYGYKYEYAYDYEYAESYKDDTPSGEIITKK